MRRARAAVLFLHGRAGSAGWQGLGDSGAGEGLQLRALGDVGAGRNGAEERVAQLNVPAEQVDDVRQDARVVAQLKEQLVHRILAALLGRDGLLEPGDDGGQLLALRRRIGG